MDEKEVKMAKKKKVVNRNSGVAKLDAPKFGVALGIICAASMILFSLWVIFIGTGQQIIDLISQFYFGYSSTLQGMVLGAIYGFIDGFIGGYLFAYLYNRLII